MIVDGVQPLYTDESGITFVGLMDFMLNRDILAVRDDEGVARPLDRQYVAWYRHEWPPLVCITLLYHKTGLCTRG